MAFKRLLLFGTFCSLIEHGSTPKHLKRVFVECTQQLCRERVIDITAHTVHVGIGKDVDHIEQFFAREVGSKAKNDFFTVEIFSLGDIAHEGMVLNKPLSRFDQLRLHI